MAASVLVDTDVLIDFLRGYPKAVTFVKTRSAQIILSSIVVAELYAGVKGEEELATLDKSFPCFASYRCPEHLHEKAACIKETTQNPMALAWPMLSSPRRLSLKMRI